MMSWVSGFRLIAVLLVVACPTTVVGQVVNGFDTSVLPNCFKTKLVDLNICLKANPQACYDRCLALVDSVKCNPFSAAKEADMQSCPKFQEQIMVPLCPMTNCCRECVPQLLDMLSCVTKDFLSAQPAPCSATCNGVDMNREACPSSRRLLREGGNQNAIGGYAETFSRILAEVDQDAVYADGFHRILKVDPAADDALFTDCVKHMNVGGASPTPAQMANIMAKGDFLACLAESAVKVVGQQIAFKKYEKETTVNMDWEIPSVGLSLGEAVGILLCLIGVLGFCCAFCCYKKSKNSGDGGGSSKPAKSKDDEDSFDDE
mmetsp:Transcript_995/g.1932  ORF Transcript_995/g.1932 Transcript_995/m.1932 type:complete len:318 (-) Transcript_995:200-1153(-)